MTTWEKFQVVCVLLLRDQRNKKNWTEKNELKGNRTAETGGSDDYEISVLRDEAITNEKEIFW